MRQLTPGIAILLPHGALEPRLGILVELIGSVLTRHEVSNVVVLHLLNHLKCVADDAFHKAYHVSADALRKKKYSACL